MASFTVALWRFDVLSHVRVRGENFPRPDPGAISEWFEIDVFDAATGLPFDLYPNHNPHPHPDRPNRLTISWVGREVVDVYNDLGVKTGTKRGADFRSRFWPSVIRRCAKARLATRIGQTISDVDSAVIDSAPPALQRLSAGDFTLPQDLKAGSLDAAIITLAGGTLGEVSVIPRGTVSNIDAAFDSQSTDGGVQDETATTVKVGNTGPLFRGQWRFSLSAITAGSTINDATIQVNVTSVTAVDVGDVINYHSYNDTGDDDPDPDTAATKYTRSGAGTARVSPTGYNTTGSKTHDLGTTVDTEIAGNLTTPGFWSMGNKPGAGIGEDESFLIEAIENAGTDPATLTVDWTAPAAGGAVKSRMLLMGVGI